MVAQVLVGIKTTHIDKTFSYKIPSFMNEQISVGSRVLVPFGKQRLEGFVIDIVDNIDTDYDLKEIIELIDLKPVLSSELLRLGKWMQAKTLCTLVTAYQTMLPNFMKAGNSQKTTNKKVSYIRFVNDYNISSSKQKEIIELLKKKDILKSELSKLSVSALKTLINHGNVEEYIVDVNRRVISSFLG